MSLTYKRFDLVIINVSKEEHYLKTDKKALIGLVAHELMHISQRRRNLDVQVRKDAIATFKKFSPKLAKLKYPRKKINNLFAEVGRAANLTLKDVYANFELIDIGMGDYILEDFYSLYMTKKACPTPKFYTDLKETAKKDLDAIRDAIVFEIDLLSVIISFIKMGRYGSRKAKQLLDYLGDCYEINIPEIANGFDDVIQYTAGKLAWTSQFRQKYFRMIFNRVYELIK